MQQPKEKRSQKKVGGGREPKATMHKAPGITPETNSLVVSLRKYHTPILCQLEK